MSATFKITVALGTILALCTPQAALAGEVGGQLEGIVLNVDGRPAVGHVVHLIDDEGIDIAQSTTDDDGRYTFEGLAPGSYGIGVESPDGWLAPVGAAAIVLAKGQLVRRDIKLLEADESSVTQAAQANYGVKLWWAGLSTGAKAGLIVAIVFAGYGLFELTSTESTASGVTP